MADAACLPVTPAELDAAILAFCQASIVMPCAEWGTSVPACQAQIDNAIPGLDPCCLSPLVTQFECGATYGFRCSEISFDLLFAPECSAVEEVVDQCLGSGDNCSLAVGSGTCEIECDQYAAKCLTLDGGGYACTCTFGPHLGEQYTLTQAPCNPPENLGAEPCK